MKHRKKWRMKKTYLVHPASVRACLKRAGIEIGRWCASSRVSGWGNFYGNPIYIEEEPKFIKTVSHNAYQGTEYFDVMVRLEFPREQHEEILRALDSDGFQFNVSPGDDHYTVVVYGKREE